jgi:hypothetical protein
MCITNRLTTTDNSADFSFLLARIRAPGRGRGISPTDSVCRSLISSLLCVIQLSVCTFKHDRSRGSSRNQTIQRRPATPLAEAREQRKSDESLIRVVRSSRCHSYCPAQRAKYHNPFILLNLKLSHRRLECKRNLRPKYPQNRLRASGLAVPGHTTAVASPLRALDQSRNRLITMSCCFLKLLLIGGFRWPIHVIPCRTGHWRLGR